MPAATRITVADVTAALNSFDWAAWKQELADRYGDWHTGVVQDEGATVAAALGGTWQRDDPYLTRFVTRYIAERVTQLSDTTRDDLRDTIAGAFEDADQGDDGEGLSVRGLSDALSATFDDFSTDRANTIARTETAIAENQAAAFGYTASGYNYVEISDGDSDSACAAADGQIWSVEYWLANPIEHPNCERSGAPISDEDAKDAGIDQE